MKKELEILLEAKINTKNCLNSVLKILDSLILDHWETGDLSSGVKEIKKLEKVIDDIKEEREVK